MSPWRTGARSCFTGVFESSALEAQLFCAFVGLCGFESRFLGFEVELGGLGVLAGGNFGVVVVGRGRLELTGQLGLQLSVEHHLVITEPVERLAEDQYDQQVQNDLQGIRQAQQRRLQFFGHNAPDSWCPTRCGM